MLSPRRIQRLLGALLALLLLSGGFFVNTQTAAAANGYDISLTGNTAAPSSGISADGNRVCTVWTTFDLGTNVGFVRIYTISSQSWDPPLSDFAFQFTGGDTKTQGAHCAFDGRGNLHIAWNQGASQQKIYHRFLPAGSNAGNNANWSGITELSGNGDASDIDAVQSDPNGGRVWIVNRTFSARGDNTFDVEVRSGVASGGTMSWTGQEIVPFAGNPGSPSVRVDDAGFVHLIANAKSSDNTLKYAFRDPNGNWSGFVNIPGSGGAHAAALAVNRTTGESHVIFGTDFDKMYYTKTSGFAGTSFSARQLIAQASANVTTKIFYGMSISWSRGGRLAVTADDSKQYIVQLFSDSNGANWTQPAMVANPPNGSENPTVVVDRAGGLYITYANHTGARVYFTFEGAPGSAPSGPSAPAPTCTSPSLSCWSSLGGILTDSPAAANLGSAVYVFANGSDHALYVKASYDGGNTYGQWENLGGYLTGAPSAASYRGRIYVFVKGSDNALYMKVSEPNGTFPNDWVSLGGILTAPPAAASNGAELYVFAKGSDNALYFKRSDDGIGFSEWGYEGGILTTAPAATGFQGKVYVFVRGSDNALYQKFTNGGGVFTNWTSLGGILTDAPAAASYTPNGGVETMYTFARGTTGHVYERHTTDGTNYTGWVDLGGEPKGPPAAAGIPGRLFVYVRWSNNELYTSRTP